MEGEVLPDYRVLTRQLGRPPRGLRGTAVWCPYGFPAVIESYPYLEDGTPFPTTFYLTCPSAVDAAGRLESEGGVGRLRRALQTDDALRQALYGLEELYRARRRELFALQKGSPRDGGAVLNAGIGGPAPPERLTCLHAVLAAFLALVDSGPRAVQAAGDAGTLEASIPSSSSAAQGALQALRSWFGETWCRDMRCVGHLRKEDRVAVIDVGTNSVRVLVAETSPAETGGFRPVHREARVTRLGEGLSEGGGLDRAARDRTEQAVREYVRLATRLGSGRTAIFGTSAVREAEDGARFLRDLGHHLGVQSWVLAGDEEAELSFRGATLDITGEAVLLDLGGGSTELVRKKEGRLVSVSLPLGSVRATERWVKSDPPDSKEREAIRREAYRLLDRDARRALEQEAVREPSGPEGREPILVGVAGTVTTLACLVLGLAGYEAEKIHRSRLSRSEIARVVDHLASLTEAGRAALPCMQPGREKVIVAGGDILTAVMDFLEFDSLVVSERDILDGAVLRLLADEGPAHEGRTGASLLKF
ncbi:MAG: hypothetical protein Kow00129_03270 [Thermoleophilia bacterium]